MSGKQLPEPSCPSGYTRDDLARYFGIIPGEANPLWDIVHAHEAKCECVVDETGKRHGIVHPVEAFKGVKTWVK